ncbi:MAG TPA: type II secretion system protein GspK [Gemmataceae bacterium]|jgi:type II secretory pathway component PulK|nr:type II secretion system protein GspK [Gemmataceae bacterium]
MLLHATATGSRSSSPRRGGFVIVAVLMVVTVLSLAAYQYSALMDAEVLAAERIRKTAEARALADSGVDVAMAYVADRSAFTGKLNSNPFDNQACFQNILVRDGSGPRAMGRFSVVSLDFGQDSANGSLPIKYGLNDEAGKININALFLLDSSGKVLHDALMKLPSMTDDIAWSIVTWIDPDPSNTSHPPGANDEFYSSLHPPYKTKCAPLDTIEELLLVKGVTPSLLFGNDKNRNGKLDPGEDDGMGFTPGWAAYLTVYSREQNVDADGNPRINLNGNDLTTLQSQLIELIGQDLTTFILAYRLFGSSTSGAAGAKGANGAGGRTIQGTIADLTTRVQQAIAKNQQARQRISSLFSLVSAAISIQEQQQGGGGGGGGRPMGKGGNQPQQSQTVTMLFTSPLADKAQQVDLLGKLLDKTTTQNGTELPAKININTAPREVLLALPGLTEAAADEIVAKRPQWTGGDAPDSKYGTIAWLLEDASLPVATLQSLERYATARTQVYRVQSIGYFDEAGPMARVEAVIDTNLGKPRIVYYRDLTDLGRSIDPRNLGR